jgi:transcriptional regulator with XRE-family HTH domain
MTNMLFAETLRKLRSEKEMSQRELAERMYVTRSAVVRWENGSRMPDAAMITRLSRVLGTDIGTLFSATAQNDDSPIVIMVDDNKAILSDSLPVLEEVMPSAVITGFIWPQEALDYAKTNRIALAILDIELGTASGLDLCRALLEINPCTRVIFLTAYPEYSLKAWDTDACGFMVKPLTTDGIHQQLRKLRCSFSMGGADE